MRKCNKKCLCACCLDRDVCPSAVRRNKRARRPLADSASMALMQKAAAIMSKGWYSCEALGRELYGTSPSDRSGRMGIMVRARRPINRMRELGIIAMRPSKSGVAEYTLLPDGMGVLGC